MSNKIKEFLGDDAVKAVENNPEMAGRLIIESLGLRMTQSESVWFYSLSDETSRVSEPCEDLVLDLNLVADIEKAVIQKVGAKKYGFEIAWLVCDDITKINKDSWDITEEDFCSIATADAKTRCVAMLLTLGEVEG